MNEGGSCPSGTNAIMFYWFGVDDSDDGVNCYGDDYSVCCNGAVQDPIIIFPNRKGVDDDVDACDLPICGVSGRKTETGTRNDKFDVEMD